MKSRTNIFNEWAEKMVKEHKEKVSLINMIVEIIQNLNNSRLIEVLNFVKTLDRAQKMEFKAELENGKLTEYGKEKLEQLKKELGESQ